MGHTYSHIRVHVIFSTKHREPTIHEAFRPRLYKYMAGIASKEFGFAIRIGGTENHVHGLISLRTDVSIADAMQKWKSLSSGWVHKTIDGAGDFAWQTGYGAFSVSASNEQSVIQYIDNQVEHHRTTTFEQEFVAFLERHGIGYDPQYVWD